MSTAAQLREITSQAVEKERLRQLQIDQQCGLELRLNVQRVLASKALHQEAERGGSSLSILAKDLFTMPKCERYTKEHLEEFARDYPTHSGITIEARTVDTTHSYGAHGTTKNYHHRKPAEQALVCSWALPKP